MLTDTKLRALRPRNRMHRVADANGFCIEVAPNGPKHWRYRFRYNGKASMAALGEYPIVTLVEARRRRDEAWAALSTGVSPVAAARARRSAQAERAGNTFAAVAAVFFAQRARKLAAASFKREQRLVEQYLGTHIGNMFETGL